jgi:hypothetical protein
MTQFERATPVNPRQLFRWIQVDLRPKMSDTRNNTKKITKSTFAIQAAVPAIPAKPSNAATKATIKNVIDQPSITNLSLSSLKS